MIPSHTEVPHLAGKVAMITGAASGLGAALAEVLADAGAHIIAADIDEPGAVTVAERLRVLGACAFPLILDVGNPAAVAGAVAAGVDHFGKLDILINNAGTDQTLPLDELTVEQWLRVINTNLNGPFLLAKHVTPYLHASAGGHMVNIASTAAKRAWPNASAYHASKWGLLGLSHALHAELRPYGIKVTAVVAGGMRTPFLLERFPDIDPATLQDPVDVARAIKAVLLMPPGTVVAELTVLPLRESSWP